jgi:hypothetical protein
MRRVLLAAVAALVFVPAAQAWTWPAAGQVLRPFLFGDDPYAGGQHRGVDIGGDLGAHVRAPAAGTVSFAGTVPGGGRTITIQTADGYAVTLLQLGEILAQRGEVVEEGAVVGRIGPSGDAVTAEPHVHLGIRIAADPDGYVDPLTLLPPRQVSAAEPVPDRGDQGETAGEAGAPAGEKPTSEAPVTAEPATEAPVTAEQSTEAPTEQAASADPVSEPAAAPEHQAADPVDVPAPLAVPTASAAIETSRQSSAGVRLPAPQPLALRAAASPVDMIARHAVGAGLGADGRLGVLSLGATAQAFGERAVPHSRPAAEPGLGLGSAPPRAAAGELPLEATLLALLVLLPLALLGGGLALLGRRKARPMMVARGAEAGTEDPRGSGVAVCERAEAHRPRGGVRRPVRHLRALSPAEGQRRPHGQRHGRARDADHGHRRQRGTIAA